MQDARYKLNINTVARCKIQVKYKNKYQDFEYQINTRYKKSRCKVNTNTGARCEININTGARCKVRVRYKYSCKVQGARCEVQVEYKNKYQDFKYQINAKYKNI